jgi:hypothetical protein
MPLDLIQYFDLLGKVRYGKTYYSIRSIVQPDDPDVKEIADTLIKIPNFAYNAQAFVHQFVPYDREIGDFWATPAETMSPADALGRFADCDDSAILLCSILRNYIDPLSVFVVVGTCKNAERDEGHAWVVVVNQDGTDQILESTASPDKPVHGRYTPMIVFNDKYAFATKSGLKEWDMKPVPMIPEFGEFVDLKGVGDGWKV